MIVELKLQKSLIFNLQLDEMQVERTGLILYAKKYAACVAFYAEILELPILFQNDDLTSFDFFGSYLMVEKEDRLAFLKDDSEIKNHSCIRLNVDDVFKISEELKLSLIHI